MPIKWCAVGTMYLQIVFVEVNEVVIVILNHDWYALAATVMNLTNAKISLSRLVILIILAHPVGTTNEFNLYQC